MVTLTKHLQDVDGVGQADAGALSQAREAFHAWMRKWDYLAEGPPADADVDELLRSILRCTARKKVDAE
jgi:hypothetical protein